MAVAVAVVVVFVFLDILVVRSTTILLKSGEVSVLVLGEYGKL